MLARSLVVLACLVPLAFLALQVHSVRLEGSAIDLVEAGEPSAADAEEAEDLLDRAGKKNPTSEPEFRKAQLFAFTDEPERAVELLKKITADEPDHLPAWILLARAADRAGDPDLAEQARDRAQALNPQAGRLAQ